MLSKSVLLLDKEKKEENADKLAKKNSDGRDSRAHLLHNEVELVGVTVYKISIRIYIS